MSILTAIASWLLQQLLAFLYSKASSEIQKAVEQMEKDKQQGQINEKNTKAYEDAKDRADRIAAATKLLNRDP